MISSNPFCLLNIPMSAGKTEIRTQADVLSMTLDPEVCDDAFAELINPAGRLRAELDWFPEDNEEVIAGIREAIAGGRPLHAEEDSGLSASGRLNAALYDLDLLSITGSADAAVLEKAVKEIDTLLSRCRIDDIIRAVNLHRAEAEISPAEPDAAAEAWKEKRYRAASAVSSLMEQLPDREYISLIGRLTESCREERRTYTPDTIIYDITDRYELHMQPKIEKLTQDLYRASDSAAHARTSLDMPFRMRRFRKCYRKWLPYVRPVQIAGAARGSEHEPSRIAGLKAIKVTQKAILKDSLYEANILAEEMIEDFACVPSLRSRLENNRDLMRKGIEVIAGKDPDKYIRIERRQRKIEACSIWIFILMSAIIAVYAISLPTEEEAAQDPDSATYKEMMQPEKRDIHGDFQQVKKPVTGFVFQDTMGDDRSCAVTVINNDHSCSCFLRFSDGDYGDESIFLTDEIQQLDGAGQNIGSGKVLSFFVRSGEETEISLPPGEYLFSCDRGTVWYGWKCRFEYQPHNYSGTTRQTVWPVMTFGTHEPYSFEAGESYTLELLGSDDTDGPVRIEGN